MSKEYISILGIELQKTDKAQKRLLTSYDKARQFINDRNEYTDDELEVIEGLTSRFARLSDILISKIFRLLEKIDLDDSKTVRDCIILAEKKGLTSSGEKFFRIRELRNLTAHEYEEEDLFASISEILELIPVLFDSVERVKSYSAKYL